MEHYYNKLEHWFDYEDVFLEAIQKAKDGDHFVEIGVWKGGSAAFMGVEISNSGKKIRYDAIDCFAPTQEFGKLTEDIYEEAKLNLKPLTDLGLVNLIKAHSLDVVSNYEDNSLSLVFIDGSHTYEDVKADLLAWLPKVKSGGMLAGHDYGSTYHVGVYPAVGEVLGNDNVRKTRHSSFVYIKK